MHAKSDAALSSVFEKDCGQKCTSHNSTPWATGSAFQHRRSWASCFGAGAPPPANTARSKVLAVATKKKGINVASGDSLCLLDFRVGTNYLAALACHENNVLWSLSS